MSDSFWPHGLQQASLLCPSPTSRTCSNSCPSSWWCHPTTSSSVVPFSSRLQSFVASVFFSKSFLPIRWPKYWSFSFSLSPFNEYSGLITFRMDWLDLLAVQGTLKSLIQHHSSKASSPRLVVIIYMFSLYIYIYVYMYIISLPRKMCCLRVISLQSFFFLQSFLFICICWVIESSTEYLVSLILRYSWKFIACCEF